MNMRNEWTIGDNIVISDMFYNREETIENAKENFDIRRFYTPEGYDIVINGITERCLVQMPSNPLRELNDYRKIHCPINADVKRGYYVEYEDNIWLIDTNVANVDGAYLSTRMSRCQYLLRWQNKNGDIIERWSYSSDQTKYSNGETGSSAVTVGDNQYALLLPIDEETKTLKRGMRFAVDFEDSEEPDIYRISNRKVNLNNETYFDRGGTMYVTLSFDSFNRDTDKYIELKDGRWAWICNYNDASPTPPITPPQNLTIRISGKTDIIIGHVRKYKVDIFDKDENIVPWDNNLYSWNIVSNFNVVQTINENKINLKVTDDSLIGESFLLQVVSNGSVLSELSIDVTDIV